MLWQRYYQPASVAEALDILAEGDGETRLVAGATDMSIRLRRGELQVQNLVDITRIPGLDQIERTGDRVRIGAQVTHGQASASSLLRDVTPVLAEACQLCGSPQIRNVGTLVGNVVNAQPAADATTALLALDACLVVMGAAGERRLPVSQACLAPGRSAIDPTREIVTSIEFDLPRPVGSGAYERLSQRRSLTLPVMACAVVLRVDAEACCVQETRIAVGPVAPVPWRAQASEKFLEGRPVDSATVAEAARLAMEGAQPRNSLRGGAEYRREMVQVLVRRALVRALERAGIHV